VLFVDDSLSTNVLPTLAAMDAFPGRRVALIAGGHDRGIDYAPLAAGLAARDAPTLVLAVPDSGPRIQAAIEAESPARWRSPPCDRPGGGGRARLPLGAAGRGGAALAGRAELRPIPRLPGPGEAFARAMRACTA
jgi:hypothetical protein